MVPPGKQQLILSAHSEGCVSVDVGVGDDRDDRDLVEEDHQTLNNQVNQYFQHIKQYASDQNGNEEEEDDDEEEEDGEEENGDVDVEDAVVGNRYVHHGGVDVDVDENAVDDVDFGDVGVDLELNIDRAISESLANYNSAQIRDHHIGSSVGVGVNVDLSTTKANTMRVHPIQEKRVSSHHEGVMLNERVESQGLAKCSNTPTAVNTSVSNVNSSSNTKIAGYGVIGTDVVLKSNHSSSQTQVPRTLTDSLTQLKSETPSDNSKRECRFCGKTFQHAGSLGRHLDNQKGNELHPLEEVEKIRSNVARRGDPEAIKARRLQRSKEYNRREYVKEKNRLRRKFTSKLSRVKESYQMKFYRKINHPTLPTHPSFPRMVLFFLPPNAWPHDPPTAQTFKTLVMWLESNQEVQLRIPHLTKSSTVQNHLEKLTIGFENWQTLSTEDKKDMWIREQRAVFQQLLGDLSIFDFAIRDNWAKHLMEEKKAEIDKQKEIYHDVLMSESNASRTDVNSDQGHHSSSHEFHDSENHYSQSQNDSDDSNSSVQNNHRMVNMDPLRNVGDMDHMDNIDSMDNMDLGNMSGLGDHHDNNEVKLEEADLAAVAAAAAAAAVKENGFHSVD